MSEKRKVTAAVKKQIAGKQRFTCAANVQGYSCPLNNNPFDEAGYEIDHIIPLSERGSNEASNLQALCLMCHRVKSNRASSGKEKPKKEKKVKEDIKPKKEEQKIYYWPDDAHKLPSKIRLNPEEKNSHLNFGLWLQRNGYQQFSDGNGDHNKLYNGLYVNVNGNMVKLLGSAK
jgi:hypothetical protein